jgi:hypothetical protein
MCVDQRTLTVWNNPVPSAGARAPGRTKTTSPTLKLEIGTVWECIERAADL